MKSEKNKKIIYSEMNASLKSSDVIQKAQLYCGSQLTNWMLKVEVSQKSGWRKRDDEVRKPLAPNVYKRYCLPILWASLPTGKFRSINPHLYWLVKNKDLIGVANKIFQRLLEQQIDDTHKIVYIIYILRKVLWIFYQKITNKIQVVI